MTLAWIVLGVVVLACLAVDLVGHRGDHGVGKWGAIVWSLLWLAASTAFCGWIAVELGGHAAATFATAWLTEKSLSIDNLFVFYLVFSRLRIPESEQHRVLFWGILGALVTRGLFIAGGMAVVHAWHAVLYPMGAFLVWTGIATAREDDDDGERKDSKLIAFVRRHLRLEKRLHGHSFFVTKDGRTRATPLFVAAVVIELADVFFAVDSIPAVFSVTTRPFLVYSSNVFAILGLRALYLVLVSSLRSLPHLNYAVAAILVFAGAKMLTSHLVHVPGWASLVVVLAAMGTVVAAALVQRRSRVARASQLEHGRLKPNGDPIRASGAR